MREAPHLGAADDERLPGLEGGDRGRSVPVGQDGELPEDVARAPDRERHLVAERRRDADIEAPLRDEVHRVGRVVPVEDDLAAPIRAPAREREHRADVLLRKPREDAPLHVS